MNLRANWSYPTVIKFGSGRVSEISNACALAGIKKPILITDSTLVTMNITKKLLDHLNKAGLGRATFSDFGSNPNEINVEAGIKFYNEGSYDGVIAFGGGSSLDLGKVIAFFASQTRPLWDFEDVDEWWKRANVSAISPIIAIPTTAGTGSEVGRASVITNSITKEKKIIFHPKLLPTIVICDPELTLEMPSFLTAGTGLDAFAHCVEAFCSPNYHPMSQGMALQGMKLIKDYLPRAFRNGLDIEARTHMMSAASMGATAFQKGLGAIHALSHPIGAIYDTHHGTTNAVCMPAVLQFNRTAIAPVISQAAKYLGIKGGFDGFCSYVDNLNKILGIPKNLRALNIKTIDVDRVVAGALIDPSAASNPIKMTKKNTTKLLLACF